jgi:hypothetical protein
MLVAGVGYRPGVLVSRVRVENSSVLGGARAATERKECCANPDDL